MLTIILKALHERKTWAEVKSPAYQRFENVRKKGVGVRRFTQVEFYCETFHLCSSWLATYSVFHITEYYDGVDCVH